jgi:CRP/FNR family transcriptional regulator, anaerobic regulatory protein
MELSKQNDLNWLTAFPSLLELEQSAKDLLAKHARIAEAPVGAVGYRIGTPCKAYVMRLQGLSRVYRISENGREILLYRVGAGETCVLTTTCLLGHTDYPAETTVEESIRDVVVPGPVFHQLMQESPIFRKFVMENYGSLITDLIVLLETVAFKGLEARVASMLISSEDSIITKTHQQLAAELGTAREVISRLLKKFEDEGWIRLGRGNVKVIDRPALQHFIALSANK